MQIKPKFPRFCGSVRYRDAGHTPGRVAGLPAELLRKVELVAVSGLGRDLLDRQIAAGQQFAGVFDPAGVAVALIRVGKAEREGRTDCNITCGQNSVAIGS